MTQSNSLSKSAANNMKWLLITRGIRSFSQALLSVIVPLFLIEAGFSTRQVGLLLTIVSFGTAGMVLSVGLLADIIGRKSLLIIIAVISTVGTVVYALTTNYWILVAMGAIAAVGRGGGAGSGGNFGPFYPAEQPLVAASVSHTRRTSAFAMMSFVGVLTGAAGSLAAAMAHILNSNFKLDLLDSYKIMFLVGAVAAALLIFTILPLKDFKSPKKPGKGSLYMKKESVRLLLKLWSTNSLMGLGMGMLGPFLTYWFAIHYHVDSAQVGVLYTVVSLMSTITFLAAARVARKLGVVHTVTVVRTAASGVLLAMTFAPTFLIASPIYVCFVLLNSMAIPIRQSFVMGVSSEEDRSKIAALSGLPPQGTSAIAPTIGARMIETLSQESPFWMAAGILFVNALLYSYVFRNTVPPEEVERRGKKAEAD